MSTREADLLGSTIAVTTAHILARKALEDNCGQECVDWAIHLLETGHDGDYVARLAGMLPPHNPFEIAEMRDRVLSELEQPDLSPAEAIRRYVVEISEDMLNGELQLVSGLAIIKDLCVANDYQSNIYDFYLLYFAYCDLQDNDVQYYWPDATRENVTEIIRDYADRFISSQRRDTR